MSIIINVDPDTLKALKKAKDYADQFGDFECSYIVLRLICQLEGETV